MDFLEDPGSDATQFGQYIHKIFEDGVEHTTQKPLLEIAKKLKDTYTFDAARGAKTSICISNFIKFNKSLMSATTVSTEQKFLVKVTKDLTINGIIDRIVKGNDGGYLVIDYKTSKRPSSKRDLMTDPQMMMYAIAVHHLYKVPFEKITLMHFYPHLDKIVTIQYPKITLQGCIRKLTKMVWEVRKKKKDEFVARSNMFCGWCAYQALCPIMGGGNHIELYNEEISKKRIARKLKESKAKLEPFTV